MFPSCNYLRFLDSDKFGTYKAVEFCKHKFKIWENVAMEKYLFEYEMP